MLCKSLFAIALGFAVVGTAIAQTAKQDEILLYYTGRPPFIWKDEHGIMHGISYEIGEQVFRAAHIPYQWVRAPSARVKYYFDNDKHALCLVNWIYTDERKQLGRISLPTYIEQDYLAVVPKRNAKRFTHADIQQLLQDPSISVIVKEGYAYSTVLTNMLNSMKAKKWDLRADQQHNFALLAGDRADIGFFEQQELQRFTQQYPALMNKVAIIRYDELNATPTTRHIICSKSVTETQMQKIDTAIKTLHLDKSLTD